jgi:hypothetical protein
VLGEKLQLLDYENKKNPFLDSSCCCSVADQIILHQAGLILDLRSAVERNDDHAQYWMNHPIVEERQDRFCIIDDDDDDDDDDLASSTKLENIFLLHPPDSTRFVIRLDVLNPSLFMQYADDNWLATKNRAQLLWYKAVDGQKLHEWRMDELNARGLAGLNEAILETGKKQLCQALQLITLYREGLSTTTNRSTSNNKVVIHCVQGKDRCVSNDLDWLL